MLVLVPLDDPAALNPADVGGKAARLAQLSRAGFDVPAGFCVPADAYRAFIASNGLRLAIERLVALLDAGPSDEQLRVAAAAVRAEIEGQTLPPGLADAVAAALARLDPEPTALFAVRSSAPNEDLAGASFAGQLDTFLNVPAGDVPDAIRRCWSSLWTERVIRYRAGRGFDQLDATMAVLVQKMVPSETAGVAFSRDPISGADFAVIEATLGLGESLARGEVEPDRHQVDKATLVEIRPPSIGAKAFRRTPGRAGGTRFEIVPPWQRRRPALDARLVRELTRLLVRLEDLFGGPQDVEWGVAHGRLVVFQTRPITALGPCSPATASVYDDEFPRDGSVWTSGFLEERFPEPLSPLGWSAIQPGFERYALRDPLRFLGADDFGPAPLTRLYRGHPYVAVEVFRRLYKLFPDRLLPEDVWRYFPDGDVADRKRAAKPRSILAPRVWWSLVRGFLASPSDWSPLHNHRHWERFSRAYEREIAAIAGRLADLAVCRDPEALLGLAAEIEAANARLLRIHRWSLTHADLLYTLLRRLGRLWLGPAYVRICADLVAALGDRSFRMDADLRALADRARAEPDVASVVRRTSRFAEATEALDESEAGRAFLDVLGAFVSEYGHRSYSLDIARPTFGADPSQLLRLIGVLLDGSFAPGDPLRRRQQATKRAREIIRSKPFGFVRWPLFDWLLGLTQAYVRLREDERFAWQRGLALLRRLYLSLGAALVARGGLGDADDVFFLQRAEFTDALRSDERTDLSLVVEARRREYRRLCAEHERSTADAYPRFLVDGRPLRIEPTSGESLRGQPASPGRATGLARVVLSPDELPNVRPGEILVTRGADPGWTPLFGTIGGLVMESGGQLSHGSVVAREYGIPAVVGVGGVTARLRDGELIAVDGEAGTVTRLSELA